MTSISILVIACGALALLYGLYAGRQVMAAPTGNDRMREIAAAIQEGLAAKAAGDDRTATTKLGRAIQLAAQTGNEEATSKLRKVVDVEDAGTGTVRLKRQVEKADEMALDTASTKTTRIRG